MFKNARRFILPKKRVFRALVLPTRFTIQQTEFNRIFNTEEIEKLIGENKAKNMFNGESIRLDSVSIAGECNLSIVGFFDFLTTNLVYLPANQNKGKKDSFSKNIRKTILSFFDSEHLTEIERLTKRLKLRILEYGKLNSFNEVLAVSELANIVTVSTLLKDSTGRFLLVKRGKDVAVSSGTFAVSSSGSVAAEDLEAENPFLNCAIRELQEELGITTTLECTDLIISKQKLQPAVLFFGSVNQRWEMLLPTIYSAPDFNKENSSIYAVPEEAMISIIHNYQFTDVAAYQLFSSINQSWFKLCKKVDIQEYELIA